MEARRLFAVRGSRFEVEEPPEMEAGRRFEAENGCQRSAVSQGSFG
jgi:hypothetical protein